MRRRRHHPKPPFEQVTPENQRLTVTCVTCRDRHWVLVNQCHIGGQDLRLWFPCVERGGQGSKELTGTQLRWLLAVGVKLAVSVPDTVESLT